MKTAALLLVLIVSQFGCSRDAKFLENVPPGTRYAKTYSMSRSSTEAGGGQVDILWVIDNSGSMGTYQQQVIANSDKFIRQFTSSATVQWKMGMISTDSSQTPFMGFGKTPVDWLTNDVIGIFNRAVAALGIGGSSWEQTFDPVLRALDGNKNFLRPGAFFAMIVVTDEEEQTNMTAAKFVQEIAKRRGGNSSRFVTYTVKCCSADLNTNYTDIVKLTNGKSYDLQSQDYGALLSTMGNDVVSKVMSGHPVVVLDQRPDPSTILVSYKGKLVTQWTYDPEYNVIRLDPAAIDWSTLDVKVSFELEPVYAN